jgi:hypothetical protein
VLGEEREKKWKNVDGTKEKRRQVRETKNQSSENVFFLRRLFFSRMEDMRAGYVSDCVNDSLLLRPITGRERERKRDEEEEEQHNRFDHRHRYFVLNKVDRTVNTLLRNHC